ncbi:MAG: hypothetical protein AB7F88_16145 [Pyrinomonadaceae bacterium]
MFEQESYDQATRQAASQPEGELFSKYEIRNWEFSPLVYKILAASAVLHIIVIAVIAQTNVLTMRGCDSPWVSRVCQVVDVAYLGAMLYGTDRDFVDEAYDNIDLGEAEITYIDVTGETPPLEYPEGYFQIANPVQYAMLQQGALSPGGVDSFQNGTTPYTPLGGGVPDLFKVEPKPPTADPNAFEPDSSSLFKVEDTAPGTRNPVRRKGRGGKVKPGGDANTTADPTADDPNAETAVAATNTNTSTQSPQTQAATPTDPDAGLDFNKRPIEDLGNWVNEKVEKKEVDLQTDFLVNARGKLDKNGRFDPKTFEWVQAISSDEDMVEVVKRAIEAINMAGYLQYLKDISGKDLNFQIQQDAENISAVVLSEMESDTRAKSVKSGLDLLISVAKLKKQSETADQNDKDDLLLLENAHIETDGKRLILKFVVPKAIAHPMIQRKLAEQAAEMQKPRGTAPVKPENNTAIK